MKAEFIRGTPASGIDLGRMPDFNLGKLRVSPAHREVTWNGDHRILEPRVMKVLVALAEARSAVLSRDRLIELCWDGRIVGDDALNRCILALRHLARDVEPTPFAIETVPRVGYSLSESPARHVHRTLDDSRSWVRPAAAAILAVLVILAVLIAKPNLRRWEERPRLPTIMVAAAVDNAASQALARDLAVQLGSLEAIHSASMRLMGDAENSRKPDLILEVGRTADPVAVGASVALTAPANREILWSMEFQQGQSLADLKQQIAFTAARVLSCALEGMADQLNRQTLKIYVNACASLADYSRDRRAVQMLEQVVKASPRFIGGWAKLLTAETNAVADDRPDASVPALKRHIALARELRPGLAEAYIAEHVVTSPTDFLASSRLVETAVRRNPNHAGAHAERAMFLQSVGRMNEGVTEAREALKLDPLSPTVRDNYISALGSARQTEAAAQELANAERLWPGASSLLMARYRHHLRFGDPREALRLLRTGAIEAGGAAMHESFLQARINPSAENVRKAIQQGRGKLRRAPEAIDGYAQTLAEFDQTDELLDTLLNWRRMDLADYITGVLFRPAFADLHRDPRFIRVVAHLGLLKYWRVSGNWPDFCFAPGLPYDCKEEAARIANDATG